MLPMVSATIKQAEERGEGHADPTSALDPSVAKALRRRQRGISRKKVYTEADTVFKVRADTHYEGFHMLWQVPMLC